MKLRLHEIKFQLFVLLVERDMAAAQTHTLTIISYASQCAQHTNTYTVSKIHFHHRCGLCIVKVYSSCMHMYVLFSVSACAALSNTHRHLFFPNTHSHTPFFSCPKPAVLEGFSPLCGNSWLESCTALTHTYTTRSQTAHCVLIMRLVYCCGA